MRKQLIAIVLIVIALVMVVVFLALKAPRNDDPDVRSSSGVKQSGQPAPNKATSLNIESFAFSPKTITIKKGTTLTWTNKDSAAHTVTGEAGGPDSELLNKGEKYSYTFNETGSFAYFCKVHPEMKGTVIVTD